MTKLKRFRVATILLIIYSLGVNGQSSVNLNVSSPFLVMKTVEKKVLKPLEKSKSLKKLILNRDDYQENLKSL